nr:hypothetical protein Iba_chr10bCG9430 [Ipomoea batatas]GMD48460.1 hypothetical protein Iba_chr10fCG6600 [Ipomoea batatas]
MENEPSVEGVTHEGGGSSTKPKKVRVLKSAIATSYIVCTVAYQFWPDFNFQFLRRRRPPERMGWSLNDSGIIDLGEGTSESQLSLELKHWLLENLEIKEI